MSDTNDTTPNVENSDLLLGRVKWFNNRAGFGFVTVLSGDKKNEDVFVHHSGINVDTEQYKYLVQGEYVSFVLKSSDSTDHPYQGPVLFEVFSKGHLCVRLEMKIVVLEKVRMMGNLENHVEDRVEVEDRIIAM